MSSGAAPREGDELPSLARPPIGYPEVGVTRHQAGATPGGRMAGSSRRRPSGPPARRWPKAPLNDTGLRSTHATWSGAMSRRTAGRGAADGAADEQCGCMRDAVWPHLSASRGPRRLAPPARRLILRALARGLQTEPPWRSRRPGSRSGARAARAQTPPRARRQRLRARRAGPRRA